MAVEVVDGAGLAKMLDAERFHAVAADAAEPAERGRMAVDDGDDAAIARQRRQQVFYVVKILHATAVAAQFPCGGPSGVQPVRGGDGEQADIAVALADEANRLN